MTDDSHNWGGDAGMDRVLPLPPLTAALWYTCWRKWWPVSPLNPIMSSETSCPLIKATQEMLEESCKEEDWRNVFFLYRGVVVMIHSWNLNWEEVRRRETGFTPSLGCCCCSQQRDMLTQINRTFLGCYLSVSRVLFTWMLLLFFFFSHCLHFLTIRLFSSVPQDHFCSSSFSLFFLQFFSHKSQFDTASSLLSHIWQAWMYGNN